MRNPSSEKKRDNRWWDTVYTREQKAHRHIEYIGHTPKTFARDEAWRGRRRNGVVYTYLACKHSRGLPEEQQVPTDTTTEKVAWLYTSPVHRIHTRKVGGASEPNISSILRRNKKPP